MRYPWETERTPISISEYIAFVDSHVRVRTFKDGVQLGTFSVTSDGTDMGAEISLQNANYKIVVVGHPVTTDPIMTPEELANYLLTI